MLEAGLRKPKRNALLPRRLRKLGLACVRKGRVDEKTVSRRNDCDIDIRGGSVQADTRRATRARS